jgi:hypothetical protein
MAEMTDSIPPSPPTPETEPVDRHLLRAYVGGRLTEGEVERVERLLDRYPPWREALEEVASQKLGHLLRRNPRALRRKTSYWPADEAPPVDRELVRGYLQRTLPTAECHNVEILMERFESWVQAVDEEGRAAALAETRAFQARLAANPGDRQALDELFGVIPRFVQGEESPTVDPNLLRRFVLDELDSVEEKQVRRLACRHEAWFKALGEVAGDVYRNSPSAPSVAEEQKSDRGI